jgi:DNA-binding NarL/FixJ family response regulator
MTVADVTLSKRQREVLLRFLEGRSVVSIANELRCSEWTVRAHITALAEKIDRGQSLSPARRVLVYGALLLAEGS